MKVGIPSISDHDVKIVESSEQETDADSFVGYDSGELICITWGSVVSACDESSLVPTISLDSKAHVERNTLIIASKLLPIIKYLEGFEVH